MVGADRTVEGEGLSALRPREQDHQAAVRRGKALRSYQGRRDRHFGRRTAPDVGRPVLQIRQAQGQRHVCHRGGVVADVPPGVVHLQAVPAADQDRVPEQPLHGHGAPVAAILSRQPLLGVLYGRASRFFKAGRQLWARRHAHRESGRRRTRAEGSVQTQGRAGVPGLHYRPERERVSDGSGRQGHFRNDSGRGAVRPPRSPAHAPMNAPLSSPPSPYSIQNDQTPTMRHIISILLENESGALSRVAGLFSARGYNIESLTVAPTEDPSLSRMTIVPTGSDDVIEQITKQLNKLIEVVKVVDLSESAHIERELMLIKVRAVGKDRDEMKRMADIFRGRILDVTEHTYTIELTGTGAKLDAFIHAIARGGVLETVRTGASGISRGERVLRA